MRWLGRHSASAVAAGLCLLLAAPPALAEVIGGDQLALPGRQVNLGPGAQPLPDIWADEWILADATTGAVLAAKDSHVQRPPASTLKTLTAVTLLPRLPLDQEYKATWKDSRATGARVGLIAGKSYRVEDLFYGLFLRSGNDAAEALARANGGIRATVAQMNEMARQLQALDTVAKTPSGLDRPGQRSSAYDLALIARAGLQIPSFAEFARTKVHDFPSSGGGTYPIYSQNRLLMRGYKGAIGVKTGYTTDAGRTFVGAATRRGITLIFVGMGIHDWSADAAAQALTWGFKNHDKVTPIGVLVDPITAEPSVAADPAATAADQAQVRAISDEQLATAGLVVPSVVGEPSVGLIVLLGVLLVATVIIGERSRRRRRAGR
jgi:D-alanyl-D-alanine carboxypeptidase (penicillin-binding protein 5/6)